MIESQEDQNYTVTKVRAPGGTRTYEFHGGGCNGNRLGIWHCVTMSTSSSLSPLYVQSTLATSAKTRCWSSDESVKITRWSSWADIVTLAIPLILESPWHKAAGLPYVRRLAQAAPRSTTRLSPVISSFSSMRATKWTKGSHVDHAAPNRRKSSERPLCWGTIVILNR